MHGTRRKYVWIHKKEELKLHIAYIQAFLTTYFQKVSRLCCVLTKLEYLFIIHKSSGLWPQQLLAYKLSLYFYAHTTTEWKQKSWCHWNGFEAQIQLRSTLPLSFRKALIYNYTITLPSFQPYWSKIISECTFESFPFLVIPKYFIFKWNTR